MSASVVVDVSQALKLLDRFEDRVRNLDPFLAIVGDVLTAKIDLNFRDQVDYKGTALQQLSALTIAHRRGRKKEPNQGVEVLRDTGRLQSTLVPVVSAGALLISLGGGPANRSAAVHQFGSAKKNIPRRAVMPIDETGNADLSAEELLELSDLAVDYFNAA